MIRTDPAVQKAYLGYSDDEDEVTRTDIRPIEDTQAIPVVPAPVVG